MYYAYIIQGRNKFLYTGITWNLEKRLHEHNSGSCVSTKNKGPFILVFEEAYKNKFQAAKREREIKGWRRGKKENLIKVYAEEHIDETSLH